LMMLIKIFKCCAVVFIIVMILSLVAIFMPMPDINLPEGYVPVDLDLNHQQNDLTRLAESNYGIAVNQCFALAKKQYRYQIKWDTSLTKREFHRFGWYDQTYQQIIYIGENLSIQNQYGALQAGFTYGCLYDLNTEQAVNFIRIN